MNRLILLLVSIFLITTAGCGGGSGSGSGSESPAGGSPADGSSGGERLLTWNAPTLNVDGSPLTDLAGYKIYYGPSSGNYTGGSVNIGLTPSFDTQALPAGYYCFVVVAYDSEGRQSSYSNEACTTL